MSIQGFTDRRRLPGPEKSFPTVYDAPEEPTTTGNGKGKGRADGREAAEMRDVFLNSGLISQANGSAYIECGSVKIACAVYGPRAKPPPYSPQGTVNVEIKFAPFASHPRRAPLRDTEPPHLSHLLTQSLLPALTLHLSQHPKSVTDIWLLVLQSESPSLESTLAAGLSVACAALADAGVALNGLGVGVAVAKTEEGIAVDPTGREARAGGARVTLGVLPALDTLTDVWMTGQASVADVLGMVDCAVAASAGVHGRVAGVLAGAV
ncbi:hypothetical protein QFC20_004420 [Naganishia adeliensis]|uniref:Uncharacterized protein n=1 Tax=Naganishia adeliensis TaxID=92952 RepID=A0ACC2VZS2_9TREE|nr:hypothetical protein QFC20_004420 [Naganishia adeliensis]